jgi:hypothetical protein
MKILIASIDTPCLFIMITDVSANLSLLSKVTVLFLKLSSQKVKTYMQPEDILRFMRQIEMKRKAAGENQKAVVSSGQGTPVIGRSGYVNVSLP